MLSSGLSQDRTIGLLYSDPAKLSDGYTLIAPKHYTATYLIDNAGCVINSWENSTYEPGQSVYVLEDGTLLRACFMKGGTSTGGGEGGRIEAYDWEDNLIWEFDYQTSDYSTHHDIEPLPNGNILALVVEKKSYEECVEAGFDPAYLTQVSSQGYMLPDYVIEVEPTYPAGGTIVWEWHVWDHLVQDHDASKDNYDTDPASHPELVDANSTGGNVHFFWNHMNSIDYNADLDQIMLSVRGNSELWVIDHSTTTEEAASHSGGNYGKGGDLLYRWGNPLTYGAGTQDDQRLFDQHDCQWIVNGSPGEGNILVFNNGLKRSDGDYSSVDEIVPPVDNSGFYSYTVSSAFEPEDALWVYTAPNPSDFFSEAISGAQRLPNGNTLIDDGVHGVFWEVTSEKEIVWEYICPVDRQGPMDQGEEPELDHRGHQYNAVFKIQRYAPDYPAFIGKDMTPGDPIEVYPSNVDGSRSLPPDQFVLSQNTPNPFNGVTAIEYEIGSLSHVKLQIFNIRGEVIRVLTDEFQGAGKYRESWDGTTMTGREAATGLYICRLQVDGRILTRKMTMIR